MIPKSIFRLHNQSCHDNDSALTIPLVPQQAETVADTPQTMGNYRLIRKLGSGGMGEVWVAEQLKPIKRQVALKKIRSERSSLEILQRFEAERQALALMSHPNIAQILDVGTGPGGQPFFVMELVPGQSLTAFCDEHRLSIDQRLRLFIQVCAGVQHAHQKGIIHRDLKPSNIIVGTENGQFIPKVIDFGLAKAVQSDQRLTDQSICTGIGQIMGTYKYMSPEQAKLNNVDIDTRSDIYALGVILYELMTGSTPLDDVSIKELSTLVVLERIRDHDPPRPSRRLSTHHGNQLSMITSRRQTDSVRLSRVLSGDLDWIVMKALDKDRDRRYATSSDFAADVERYLRGEPVSARPPSVSYQLRKYARKYHKGLMATSTVAMTLVAATAFSSYWALQAQLEAARANEEVFRTELERQRADQEATKARQQQATAQESYRLMSSIFAVLDSQLPSAAASSVVERMSERIPSIAREITKQNFPDSLVRAELLAKLGRALLGFGQSTEAIGLLQEATQLYEHHHGPAHPESLDVKASLSVAHLDSGNLGEALELAEAIVDVARTTFPPDDPKLARYEAHLATVLTAGSSATSLTASYQAWQNLRQQKGDLDPDTLTALNNYAYGLVNQKLYDQAAKHFADVVDKRKNVLGEHHIDTIGSMSSLASAWLNLEKVEDALATLEGALALVAQHHPKDHYVANSIRTNLGSAYAKLGHKQRAKEMFLQIYKAAHEKFGPQYKDTWIALNNLAAVERDLGEYSLAIEHYELVRESIGASVGRKHPYYSSVLISLVGVYESKKNLELALERLSELLELRRESLAPEHSDILKTIRKFGRLHRDLGSPADAVNYFEQVYRQAPLDDEFKDAAIDWFEQYAPQSEPTALVSELPSLFENIAQRCGSDDGAYSSQILRVTHILQQFGLYDSAVEQRLVVPNL